MGLSRIGIGIFTFLAVTSLPDLRGHLSYMPESKYCLFGKGIIMLYLDI